MGGSSGVVHESPDETQDREHEDGQAKRLVKLQLTGPLRRVDAAFRSTRADDEGCQDGRSCEPMENLCARAVADLRSEIIHLR